MEVIKEKISALEKRVDKHSSEIDENHERLNRLESNLDLQKEQLKLMQKMDASIDKLSDSQLKANESTYRIETSVNTLTEKQIALEARLKHLEEQRDKDHLEKPLAWVGRVAWIVVSAIIAFLLGKFGL